MYLNLTLMSVPFNKWTQAHMCKTKTIWKGPCAALGKQKCIDVEGVRLKPALPLCSNRTEHYLTGLEWLHIIVGYAVHPQMQPTDSRLLHNAGPMTGMANKSCCQNMTGQGLQNKQKKMEWIRIVNYIDLTEKMIFSQSLHNGTLIKRWTEWTGYVGAL